MRACIFERNQMYYENYSRIREIMKMKDRDVAVATGIDPATFSHWKKGLYTPKEDKLTKIANCFGITIDDLKGTTTNSRNTLIAKCLQMFFRK